MKKVLIIITSLLIVSCNQNTDLKNSSKPISAELVDMRVYSNSKVIVNGVGASFYIISNKMESLKVDSTTTVRVFFNENSAYYLLKTIKEYFDEKKVKNLTIKLMASEEMDQYFTEHIYIDVLSSNKILFNGHEVHPDDIQIALDANYITPSTKIILNVSNQTNEKVYTRVVEELQEINQPNIFVNPNEEELLSL